MGVGVRSVIGGPQRSLWSLPLRPLLSVTFVALATALTMLFVFSAPAGAFLHRGHSFLTALETSGENSLSGPSAVAVNEHSVSAGEGAGDTYVLDKGNNRVVRFGPNHEFLEAWGVGVGGGTAYEQCKEAAKCKAGVAGFGSATNAQFDEPVAIAVDNAPSSGKEGSPSSGDVYVVANRSWKRAVIYKFNFEGTLVDRLIDRPVEKEEPWPIDGVAVDKSGVLWVDREGEEEEAILERFSNAAKNNLIDEPEEIELPEVASSDPARPGFAIDALGHVYVTYEPEGRTIEQEEELFEERSEERHLKKEAPIEEYIQPPCQAHTCLVAQVKVTLGAEERIEGEVSDPEVAPEQNTTGVATDLSVGAQSSNDVYTDNDTSISAFTSAGTLIQSFGQAQLGEGGGSGLAVNSSKNEVFAADQAHDRVDIYGPVPAGPPAVREGSTSATGVAIESAKLNATIDPTGSDTHYFFRYGTAPCASGPEACQSLAPKPPGTDIGAGFGDQAASVELRALAPSTTYYFVIVAENGFGKVEGQEEGKFTTVAANTLEAALPDGRAWELASPVDKRGVAVEPLSHEGGLIQAAASGRGIAFIASAPVGEEEPPGNRAPEPSQLIASRSSAGAWQTHNITTPNLAAQGIQPNTRREYQFFSADLELGAVYPVEPLSSTETTEPVTGLPLYLRDTSCVTSHCYEPIENGSRTNPGEDVFLAATPDLKHIAKSASNGLFEWSAEESEPGEGHMRLVSVLPNGETAVSGVGIGAPRFASFEGARRTISQDGSRVVWAQHESDEELGEIQRLYQTEFKARGVVTSTQIDEQNEEAGLAEPALGPGAVYGTSSTTGDRVFFTDDQRLTRTASTENETAGDLYVYEPGKPAGERLTDLSPPLNAGGSAAVQSGLIGASKDGAYVYFVANGVLAPDASQGACVFGGVRSAKCNLYVAHNNGTEWEKPKFVARLSNEDTPDWTAEAKGRLNYRIVEMTSRVSPNGHFLAFMSDQRLTGYNNLDANSGEPDEEVFLYDATANEDAGRLVCASCNPTGAQPVGVHDVQESGEGRGLLVDRIGIWSTETEETANAHWLAASVPGYTNLDDRESFYQSRYLSNDGRLFFNAQDSLVGQDVNGKEDVYEYEPTGAGNCASDNTVGGCVALISSGKSVTESTFLDASENGNDVFFLTSARLVPSLDGDTAFDIYDARVCDGSGAEEACPASALAPAQSCSGEECRAAPAPQPSYGPPSGSAAASGNAAPQSSVLGSKSVQKAKVQTRAQKLAAALKTCKKKYGKSKKKRAACEKQARKKYGAKKSAKPKQAASKSSSKAKR